MNYPHPYTPSYVIKPKRPRFLAMVVGFAIALAAGIPLGFLFSFYFMLLNSSGKFNLIAVPLMSILLVGTAAIAFFATRLIDRRMK